MVLRIYRVRQSAVVALVDLQKKLPSPVTLAGSTGSQVADYQVDDADAAELLDVLAADGWDLVSVDPVTPIADDFLPAGSVPAAVCVGQVLYSRDGATFTPSVPIVGRAGWLKNNQGILIVK